MAFDLNKPADTQTIAAGPGDIRENFRALKEDRIVDAQKVAGLSPGNASGNIPVSNGTLNTNLNADKLDGNDASAFAAAGHTHGTATSSSNGLMSNTDKAKLDGIAAGAEVNQNAFGNVKVGTTTIQADSKSDTLELAAGTGITLTPDATNDKVTVAVTQDGHSHAAATTSTAGFMAAADKSKLDGVAAGAQVNQNAFANVVAGGATIQADGVTDTLTINAGAGITISGDATNDALTIALTANGHSHSEATTSAGGFMSAADKSKLGGIAAGAQANQNAFSNILVGSTTVSADGPTDTLEIVAGTGITLTPDATNDRLTIAGHSNANDPTADQKAALAGTSGTPASTNRYVTNSDPRLSDARPANGGSAATATKLQTARTINGVAFDGSANITVTAVANGGTSTACSGNAATATKLAIARTINGVPFDGSANITVTQVNGKTIATTDQLLAEQNVNSNGSLQTDKGLGAATSFGSVDITTGSGNIANYLFHTIKGVSAGTYSLAALIEQLVQKSHSHTLEKVLSNCNCNCQCDCYSDC
ncbi:hypothetical protein EDC14_100190 [Hydrogenispora ethanolica]|uniref:Uncharacterized protein n=1 Tax=Hydrogenispora ethanolica TaxID=1082276 RepID=A0A4R1SBE8_HYDET|nr:hypothetical protein [Hydrogenispora ethanolica]TCL76808.1 hypothetical protein EDC14_100190 [Hydrogenispora ethanolica]